jgi:hypothetical protein
MTKNNLLKLLVVPLILIGVATFLYVKTDAMLPIPNPGIEEKAKLLIQAIEGGSVHVTEKQLAEYLRLVAESDKSMNSLFESHRRVLNSLSFVLATSGLLQCIVLFNVFVKAKSVDQNSNGL